MMMMMPLLLATMLAAANPTLDRVSVECTVSQKAGDVQRGTTAIVCDGVRGFFITKGTYLEIRHLELEHPFLKKEIQILEARSKSLMKAAQVGQEIEGINLNLAGTYKESFIQSEAALREANKDIRNMASLSVWERLGWLSLGAATVGAAWFFSRESQSDTRIYLPK